MKKTTKKTVVEDTAPWEEPKEKAGAKINAQAISNSLTDAAFVPDMTERQEELTMSQKLHNEAGDVIEKEIDTDDEEIELGEGWRGTPDNGLHEVKIIEAFKCKGRNGNPDFRIFLLRDIADGREWKTLVGDDVLNDTIRSINYYNYNMLRQLKAKGIPTTKENVINLLKEKAFKVWTQRKIKDPKEALTYFNEEKYQNYCMKYARAKSLEK